MTSSGVQLLLGPGIACLLTALLLPLVRGAAIGAGQVTAVRKDRWHETPTPTLGGIGIFLGFGLVVWVGSLLGWQDPLAVVRGRAGLLPLSPWEALVGASALAFLVGLVDDFIQLRPLAKLTGQLLAASILLTSGIGLWLTGVYFVDAFLSLLWFVGITNALNLLDNMDGLAGGVALIAAGFLAIIFLLDGRVDLAGLALALAGALLGFLVHNYPPAKIFMGDSGSLFLGMLLSGLALSPGSGLSRSLLAVVAVPALILAVPILDTTLVTVSRVLEGRSPAEGGKDHSSHRLVSLGISEERAVWILWVLSIFGGSVALLLRSSARSYALLGGGMTLVALILLGGYLLQTHFQKLRDEGIRGTALYDRLLTLHARFPLLLFALDGLLIGMAYVGAYVLRWDQPQLSREITYFQQSLPVVLVVKLVVFVSFRVYRDGLRHYGLGEALRVLQANLVATTSVVATLLMLQRTGLSRGVVGIDFLLLSVFMLASRFSFRIMESWARRWSRHGMPAVLVGDLGDLQTVLGEMERGRWPELRPVGLADRRVSERRGRFKGYLLFGKGDAPERALTETGAGAVVLVERTSDEPHGGGGGRSGEGGGGSFGSFPVEVYRLQVGLSLKKDPAAGP